MTAKIQGREKGLVRAHCLVKFFSTVAYLHGQALPVTVTKPFTSHYALCGALFAESLLQVCENFFPAIPYHLSIFSQPVNGNLPEPCTTKCHLVCTHGRYINVHSYES